MTTWAITCVFAPFDSPYLLKNFRKFRQTLGLPLLAVEVECRGRTVLKDDDATKVVRVKGDCLWQKERGLNIALEHLPADCKYVVAVDSDVVWPAKGLGTISRDLCLHPVVQPFSTVHYLDATEGVVHAWPSIASKPMMFEQGDQVAHGNVWAFRREVLEGFGGFYDRFIVGGGDLGLSAALFGRHETVPERHAMNPQRAAHYLQWAQGVYDAVRGQVSFVNTPLVHLWHGSEASRRYHERKKLLAEFAPADVEHDGTEALCWRSDASATLRRWVAAYFRVRAQNARPVVARDFGRP